MLPVNLLGSLFYYYWFIQQVADSFREMKIKVDNEGYKCKYILFGLNRSLH